MKIRKGLWYLCNRSHDYFVEGYWHYSPMDGFLNGSDNQPHHVPRAIQKHFTGGEEWIFKQMK